MARGLKHLFTLDPSVTFLNHGSYGACPRPVIAAQRAWQDALERQPVAFMDPRHLRERFEDVRNALAGELGARAQDLFWSTNATEALNLVARSLPLGPGDEILTSDHEYAALDKTWDFVCRRTGAALRRVTVSLPLCSEAELTTAILDGVSDRTRVLFLSHVTSPTALALPIARVVAEARARGIITVIDGAHGPGLIPLALDALGADFYAGNCHKWLMAPKGAGFLHVRDEAKRWLAPGVISHGWAPDLAPGDPGPLGDDAFLDAFQFRGTRDASAWLSVTAALAFRQDQNWPKIGDDCRSLALATARMIAGSYGQVLPGADEFLTQMVAIPIPPCDPLRLHDALLAEDGIEVPVIRWRDKCFVRLSVQGYNTPEEVDRLARVLARRFPPRRHARIRLPSGS
ncbi:aminotransferase class V-fold PLP-dependent enzyme [Defluviimonas sp. WL0002]|uniref:Aminotransferase class V-fold PLP-dependent enzyme n=1 Tax=Albidovulum marisflavi TaxID=2984159 RepID=A0ABT2Z993_9RHOB|nr:aminotransferase class V-fold PLP-dependent enzyme [Defluviimonas sp. WL0002]MCV2867704.1 aminotransferase class V-fold PLP-dependent enzyme [Defluviimonas sp. WL0002]